MPIGHRVKSTDLRMERHFDAKLGTIPEKSAIKHISNLNMSDSSAAEEKLKPEGREGDGLANVAALVCASVP